MTAEKISKINQLANHFNSKNPGLNVERLHNCFVDIEADYKEFCGDIKNTRLEEVKNYERFTF